MYWIWCFLFASNPAFLLIGMTGFLGSEAKKAAEYMSVVYGTIALILVALLLIYLFLRFVGLVN